MHALFFLFACTSSETKSEASQPFQPGLGSGGAFQDPSGFPAFHSQPAPPGPSVQGVGHFTKPIQLTQKPSGGYRPQIVIGKNDERHVLFYDRTPSGDVIRHRRSSDGINWTSPVQVGHSDERNWGPDLVAREDGSVAMVYDHALKDFSSRGFLSEWSGSAWSDYVAITPSDNGTGEVGSGHVANTIGNDLVYVYIGKKVGPENKFQARYRWRINGELGTIGSFSDGKADAWHTNVERRPDGSVLAGYDTGQGGSETTLWLVDGRDGRFSAPENFSAGGKPGERPHFAFSADGVDHVTWFHKERGAPKHVYVRSGSPGKWGVISEPSKGYGGFHFDPDIAINQDGVLCLVWGWDAGNKDAELVYSLNRGKGWSKPQKVADINWGKPGLSSIDVDSSGAFNVVWNQGVRGYNEVYFARLEVK